MKKSKRQLAHELLDKWIDRQTIEMLRIEPNQRVLDLGELYQAMINARKEADKINRKRK